MKVNLARNWFAPNDVLYQVEFNPHEIPDDFKDRLPSGAEVLNKEGEVIHTQPKFVDPNPVKNVIDASGQVIPGTPVKEAAPIAPAPSESKPVEKTK